MSKQVVYFLTIFLLNRLMTQFFLFALDNSKHKKGKSCLMGKILGTYYWQNDMIIKFTIIVIILSYIFAFYTSIIFLISKINVLNEMLISIPLKFLCIVYLMDFVLLCGKLYLGKKN